jgi:hypothetical protein
LQIAAQLPLCVRCHDAANRQEVQLGGALRAAAGADVRAALPFECIERNNEKLKM